MNTLYAPTDTMIDQRRIYRPKMGEWSSTLISALSSCKRLRGIEYARQCAAVLNNSALLLLFSGRRDASRRLCEVECHWLMSLPPEIPPEEAGALAVQPVVNLGRLARQSGDIESAFRAFHGVHIPDGNGELSLLGHGLRQSESLRRGTEPMYVYENLKTYLVAKRQAEGLEFLKEVRRDGKSLAPLLAAAAVELELQLLLSLDGELGCTDAMKQREWNVNMHCALTKQFYHGVILQRLGKFDLASEVLNRVWQWLKDPVKASQGQLPDHSVLRLLLETAELCELLGSIGLLRELVTLAYESLAESADVPLAVRLATLIYRHYDAPGRMMPCPADILRTGGYLPMLKKYSNDTRIDSEISEGVDRLQAAAIGVCELRYTAARSMEHRK